MVHGIKYLILMETGGNPFTMQSASEEPEIDFAAEERDFLEQETGYDYESLELMDEWERREVLEDAGLDVDDFFEIIVHLLRDSAFMESENI